MLDQGGGTPGGPPAARIGATLERRLAALREQRRAASSSQTGLEAPALIRRSPDAVERLARAVDGEAVATASGAYVRIDRTPRAIPVDRGALAMLPSLPSPDARLVCLDTETTGLGTASGTVAFLVGLGWWEGDRFVQRQLLLPDQSDEPGLLEALRRDLPPDATLVSYNGRAFDWPLLVARYRMGRTAPPGLAGHLDLLPFVRRHFRHRLPDARLRTVERELLGLRRVGDVDGWEIPGRYLGFLRGGDPAALTDVVSHNDEDVRSLARLIAHVAGYLGRPAAWADGHPGDLEALATTLRRADRADEALACLEAALGTWDALPGPESGSRHAPGASSLPTRAALAAGRARLLARLRRNAEAATAWEAIAGEGGPAAAVAWVEVAKLREHRLRDPAGALDATGRAATLAERSRALGRPLDALENDVLRRDARLRRRLARAAARPRSAAVSRWRAPA
ncbi:MAG: hypothetical protein RL338_795 [Chloroflexota bacterium]